MDLKNTIIIASTIILLGLVFSAASCNRNINQSEKDKNTNISEQTLSNTDDISKDNKADEKMEKKTAAKNDAPAQIDKAKQLELAKKQEESKALNTQTNTGFDSKHPNKQTTTQPSSTANNGEPSIKSNLGKSAVNTTIIVGKGGGVTGAVTEYQLLSSGAIMKKNGLTSELTEVKKISAEDLAVVKQKFDNLNLSTVNYNKPGNIYYYIGNQTGLKMHRVTWAGPDEALPKSVQEFYEYMMQNVIN